jgi:signal transduction histidine kinase
MYEIIDKLVLFLGCITLYLFVADNSFVIVPVIIAIIFSCIFLYFEDGRIKLTGNILFAFLCIFFPDFIIFLPLLLYDILHTKYQIGILLIPFLFTLHFDGYTSNIIFLLSIVLVISYLIKYKTDRLQALTNEYNELRDSSTQMSLLLEEKNQSLLQNQDYEINLATLNERSRISKEIHDNIGHLLSRALLQVGALLTITKEEITKDGLSSLKVSLSSGMDQIRNSIHNMYDESIDLYLQIELLVKGFTYCPISYDYDIKNPPTHQLKHSLIGITKEALANIMRHSNATKVSVILREHPAMYQLIIQDNGTLDELKRSYLSNAFDQLEYGEGMGLRNIYDRVKSFGGNINVSVDTGFKLFISIPKNSSANINRIIR